MTAARLADQMKSLDTVLLFDRIKGGRDDTDLKQSSAITMDT